MGDRLWRLSRLIPIKVISMDVLGGIGMDGRGDMGMKLTHCELQQQDQGLTNNRCRLYRDSINILSPTHTPKYLYKIYFGCLRVVMWKRVNMVVHLSAMNVE